MRPHSTTLAGPALAALATLALCAAPAAADVVAYWDFNSLTGAPGTANVLQADQGAGSIFLDGTNGSSFWASTASNPHLTALTGLSENALPGVAAGMALVLANSSPAVNGSSNGFSMVIAVSLANWQSVAVSYATRGSGSGAGFSSQAWSYSTDGVNFTSLVTVSGTNAGTTSVVDLGALSMLDNAPMAYLRVTFDGATATNGHNRIDNFLVTGTAVPAPGAAALLAMAGMAAAGRRRR